MIRWDIIILTVGMMQGFRGLFSRSINRVLKILVY